MASSKDKAFICPSFEISVRATIYFWRSDTVIREDYKHLSRYKYAMPVVIAYDGRRYRRDKAYGVVMFDAKYS